MARDSLIVRWTVRPGRCAPAVCAALVAGFPAASALGESGGPPKLPRYQIIDLGDLGGGEASALGISESGVVVGAARDETMAWRAFRWDSVNGMVQLNDDGAWSSGAIATNDAGVCVGDRLLPPAVFHAARWTARGVLEDLDETGDSEANDVNESSVSVGQAIDPSTDRQRAARWPSAGQLQFLELLGDPRIDTASAWGINDSNICVGRSRLNGVQHAVVWGPNGNVLHDLNDALAGDVSHLATDVNNAGLVVGVAGPLAWKWNEDDGGSFLPELVPRDVHHVLATNDAGDIVGFLGTAADVALVWQGGNVFDLNELVINNSFDHLSAARDINTAGQIVGEGVKDGLFRAFLLTPYECDPDLNGDGLIGPPDLAGLLDAWGPNPGHPADFDNSGVVAPEDLAHLLDSWGSCP